MGHGHSLAHGQRRCQNSVHAQLLAKRQKAHDAFGFAKSITGQDLPGYRFAYGSHLLPSQLSTLPAQGLAQRNFFLLMHSWPGPDDR